jgi:hypothetical protein
MFKVVKMILLKKAYSAGIESRSQHCKTGTQPIPITGMPTPES